jgi:hypothetical protein
LVNPARAASDRWRPSPTDRQEYASDSEDEDEEDIDSRDGAHSPSPQQRLEALRGPARVQTTAASAAAASASTAQPNVRRLLRFHFIV